MSKDIQKKPYSRRSKEENAARNAAAKVYEQQQRELEQVKLELHKLLLKKR